MTDSRVATDPNRLPWLADERIPGLESGPYAVGAF